MQEIMQLAFSGMVIEEIEKEYGQVQRLRRLEDVVKEDMPCGVIPNVFDEK